MWWDKTKIHLNVLFQGDKSVSIKIKYLHSVLLLFITLNSFYFFNMTLPSIVAAIAFIFLTFCKNNEYKLFSGGSIAFWFMLVLFFWSSFGLFFLSVEIDGKRLLFFILSLVFIFSLTLSSKNLDIRFTFKFCLLVHVVLFYLQFTIYYCGGGYLNYLEPFGLESRNFGGEFSPLGNIQLMRSSGLFNEPGTYACFVAPLIAFFMNYVESKADKIVFILSTLTLLLTFSTFGIVFFAILIISFGKNSVFKFFLIILGGVISSPYIIWRFFSSSITSADSGVDFRWEYISAIFEKLNNLAFLAFGEGGLSLNTFEFEVHGADNDAGLVFFMMYNLGFLPTVCLISLILFVSINSGKIKTLIPIFIVLISKISFYSIVFPLFLFIFFSNCENRESKFQLDEEI